MEEDEFYSRLKDELEGWQKDGVIESSQAEAIMRRYGIEKKGFKPGNAITAISTVAAVLVGVGVLLVFASNWGWLPETAKIAIILATTFGAYYAGYIMRFEEKNYPRAGHALLFLGSILVGPAIFLMASIYIINVGTPWLAFLWFLIIAPLGYFFDSRPTVSLSILIFIFWLAVSIGIESNWDVALYLYMLFGIVLYGIGQIHELTEKWSGHRMIYKGFGIFFILLFYLLFSIEPSYSINDIKAVFTGTGRFIAGAFVILAAASVLVNIVESERLKSTRYEFYVLLAALLGWIILSIKAFYPSFFASKFLVSDTLLYVIFNLLFLGLSIGTISIGYYKNQTAFVNAGILFFALGIILIYLLELSKMLPTSLGLIIGGVVLFTLASYLEKKRRALLTSMKGGVQ